MSTPSPPPPKYLPSLCVHGSLVAETCFEVNGELVVRGEWVSSVDGDLRSVVVDAKTWQEFEAPPSSGSRSSDNDRAGLPPGLGDDHASGFGHPLIIACQRGAVASVRFFLHRCGCVPWIMHPHPVDAALGGNHPGVVEALLSEVDFPLRPLPRRKVLRWRLENDEFREHPVRVFVCLFLCVCVCVCVCV